MSIAVVVFVFSTFAVFTKHINDDLFLRHLLTFSSISAFAYIYGQSEHALGSFLLLFSLSLIYWSVREVLYRSFDEPKSRKT